MRVLALVLLAACSTVSTSFDYDTSFDFSKLKSYRWADVPSKADANPFAVQRANAAVETQLKAKGYVPATGTPDFLVATYVGQRSRIQVTDWGYGYGPRAAWYGPGAGVDVYEYEEGSLIVDIVDARSKRLVWRGSAIAVVDPGATPDERTERIQEAVAKMFKDFPPPRK
jgi:hypothetical protein